MSLLTFATARLAWLRPASKIGCNSGAVPVSANVPLLNRPESSVLAVPAFAVSAMRGVEYVGEMDAVRERHLNIRNAYLAGLAAEVASA